MIEHEIFEKNHNKLKKNNQTKKNIKLIKFP